MGEIFEFRTTVRPEWIDYNGHMQDCYYGLIFSLAADEVQEAIGVGATYREETGCTIYLVEDHKFFLREVKEGAGIVVRTRVLAADSKRFHLYKQMYEGDALVCVGEYMELHVNQYPTPRAAHLPDEVQARLKSACLSEAEASALPHRARALGLSNR